MAAASTEERGAVFTRREVVEFILDLVGYTADKPLHQARILEPAVGRGDFLLPTIERLLEVYAALPAAVTNPDVVADLGDCIHAVELHRSSFDQTRSLVLEKLHEKGIDAHPAAQLVDRWLQYGDFLLVPFEGTFSHVVGNPPYVRQERIPDVLMEEYRRRYRTIYDRADIYIPFIERSLSLLAAGGQLGFICPDRWMKNRYGRPLRRMVDAHFHLRCFVNMVDTPAFHSDVIAYPGIVVIGREKSGATRVAVRPPIEATVLKRLAKGMVAQHVPPQLGITEIARVADGDQPWMLEVPHQLTLIRRLESDYPTIEDAGCKVGIGVATGADQVFIAPFDELDVEPDRKLPIVMTRDILTGTVKWRGFGVINPFADHGKLVSLQRYPKLAAYLERHGAAIKSRHASKKNPGSWYRTIDRIYPELTYKPKLLVPDIKGEAHIVYEAGKLYPHHNLYFVTSNVWDLHALQAVLLSDVTRLFIGLYSTKMRGGCLRFQAQYLRRLRVPHWRDVPAPIQAALEEAGKTRHLQACNEAAAALYGLTPIERQVLTETPLASDAT
ncbi:MAG: Eco57I restriction-modification methylase domain-containing protein [Acetobacteraceae bacterium]|nr:Eco57I restriction-modification methylase domain-containing protein [Acetobacteraceae bacterium]